jgi:hypothetical protein
MHWPLWANDKTRLFCNRASMYVRKVKWFTSDQAVAGNVASMLWQQHITDV